MKDLLRASHELYGDSSQTKPSNDIYIGGTLATSEQMTAITAKATELEAEWDAQEYARQRQAEYPDMGTQFNKIYDDGIDAWKTDMVDPIKAKYPKP
jgi:hypothetical protein